MNLYRKEWNKRNNATTSLGDVIEEGWAIYKLPEELSCDQCGNPMVVNEDGTSNHLVKDSEGVDEIDHDADADHVAYASDDEDLIAVVGTEGVADALIAAMEPPPAENWDNNHKQFPRLLAEINGVANLTPHQLGAIAESMDLSTSEVDELFDRAEVEWNAIKAGMPAVECRRVTPAKELAAYRNEEKAKGPIAALEPGTTSSLERKMRIWQDTKKGFSRDKSTGTWHWYDKADADNPDAWQGPFYTFQQMIDDAVAPYLEGDNAHE